jgi:hypothetical protein
MKLLRRWPRASTTWYSLCDSTRAPSTTCAAMILASASLRSSDDFRPSLSRGWRSAWLGFRGRGNYLWHDSLPPSMDSDTQVFELARVKCLHWRERRASAACGSKVGNSYSRRWIGLAAALSSVCDAKR